MFHFFSYFPERAQRQLYHFRNQVKNKLVVRLASNLFFFLIRIKMGIRFSAINWHGKEVDLSNLYGVGKGGYQTFHTLYKKVIPQINASLGEKLSVTVVLDNLDDTTNNNKNTINHNSTSRSWYSRETATSTPRGITSRFNRT